MARGTSVPVATEQPTQHMYKARKRHDARLRDIARMKDELIDFTKQAVSVELHAMVCTIGLDPSFYERASVALESLAIHKRDCQQLGKSVHRASDAAIQVG